MFRNIMIPVLFCLVAIVFVIGLRIGNDAEEQKTRLHVGEARVAGCWHSDSTLYSDATDPMIPVITGHPEEWRVDLEVNDWTIRLLTNESTCRLPINTILCVQYGFRKPDNTPFIKGFVQCLPKK